MKKTTRLLSIVITAIIIFAACKKSNSSPSIVGFWKGAFGSSTDTAQDIYFDGALLRNNGTCRFYDDADTAFANKAEGTYTYSSNTFKATYTYTGIFISLSSTVNNAANYINGSWGYTPSTTNGGGFYLYKQ